MHVLLHLVNVLERKLTQLLGFEHRRANCAHPGVQLGHDKLIVFEVECLTQGMANALVAGDAPNERHRCDNFAVFDDRRLEISRHRIA